MVQSDEALRFLNHMIASYPEVHNSRYWNEITPFISELAIGQCLDIGCGPGLLLADLNNRFNSTKLIGVDLSSLMIQRAKDTLDKAKVSSFELIQQHLQENYSLPKNNDLIFSSRVLRSFEEPLNILSSIHSSLRDNGFLVLLDWDKQSLSTYLSWFKTNQRFNEREFDDLVRLHRNFSRYSIDDWRVLLEHSNFLIEHTFQLDPVHIVILARKC